MSLEGETEYTLSGWFSVSEHLTWDEDSKLEILWLNGSASPVTHYYVLNLQGDVVGLIDEDSALVAKYTYSAWGEIISVTDAAGAAITSSTHIATLNPLRYRGYYYDTETGFYYLQSRYYDPVTHRFINADSILSTGQGIIGHNMSAYCGNRPVIFADPSGHIIVVANASERERQEYERAIAYLKTSDTARALIERLEASDKTFYIRFVEDDDMHYIYDGTIEFDIDSGLIMEDGRSVQSAALGLAHEFGHAALHLDGYFPSSHEEDLLLEKLNVETYEIPIARELGEPIRMNYLSSKGHRTMWNSTHFIAQIIHRQWRGAPRYKGNCLWEDEVK